MIQRTGSKYPTEVIPLTFDFSKDLVSGEEFIPGSATISVVTEEGVDLSPSDIKKGTPIMVRPYIIQSVQGGSLKTDYHFLCTVDTDRGNTYVLQCILPVRKNP